MLDLWETQKPKEPLDKTAPLRVGMQVAYVPQHVIAKYGGSAAEAILKRWKADGFKSNSKGAIKSYDGVMPNGQPQSFAQNGHPRWNKDADGNRVRNKRSVWTVTTKPYSGAHFATFPPDLIEPMILAGCPVGGIVLDPFVGSGTTVMVAKKLNRRGIGLDLNLNYLDVNARERTKEVQPILI